MGRCNGLLSLKVNFLSTQSLFFLARYTARAPISFMNVLCGIHDYSSWESEQQIKLFNIPLAAPEKNL